MYECFGLPSHAFGRYRCGISYYSSLLKTCHHPDLLKKEVAKQLLLSFAQKQKRPCLLIPTTDWYVDLALQLQSELSPCFMMATPNPEHFYEFSKKERFYRVLDTYGIAHPQTTVFTVGEWVDCDRFPVIVKPSCSYEVEKCHFQGQKKVYLIESADDFRKTIAMLTTHHKGFTYLLQPYLKPQQSFVLTVFSQKEFGACSAVLAEVVLEEVGDTSRGNYCALKVRPLDASAQKLVDFCGKIGYDGIVNFDIIRTEDGDFVLDMNMRVGRSVDHIRGAGHKVADFLLKSQNRYTRYQGSFSSVPVYWRTVRDREVLNLCPPHLKSEIRESIRNGFATSPYESVTRKPKPLEWLYQTIHQGRATRATALAYRR